MNYTNLLNSLIDEVSKGYIGNKKLVEDSLIALTSGLHILIEDISGVGKTTLCKSLAKATGLFNSRIQFTPDLLPGDITGMSIWENSKREFILKKGPIFNEFILADEINRASARTQSALLEAMEETSVTIDGTKYNLPDFFAVIATKNPSYYLGTFDLPESQLDRFGILLQPGYPSKPNEVEILSKFNITNPVDNVSTITDSSELKLVKDEINSQYVNDNVLEFTVELGEKTRNSEDLKTGLSTRSLKHLLSFAKGKAYFSNRDYVIPEDVIYSFYKVAPHKVELSHESKLSSLTPLNILKKLQSSVKIPIGI